MTEDELCTKGLISPEEYKLYSLFHLHEDGRFFLDSMINKTFMEEPNDTEFNAVGFAFYDGRRSLIRNIIKTIEKVITILKDENYVGRPKE